VQEKELKYGFVRHADGSNRLSGSSLSVLGSRTTADMGLTARCFWYLEVESPFIVIRMGDRDVNEGETPPVWASSVVPLVGPILERKTIRNAVRKNGNAFRHNHIHLFRGCFCL
jgi:hypothetical protein